MKAIKGMAVVGLVVVGLGLVGASTRPAPAYREPVETFLQGLAGGDVEKAFVKLLEGSPIQEKKSAVELLENQTTTALKIYGKALGFEPVSEQVYGDSVARVVYVLKTEQMPLAWEFYFYRPKDRWVLINVRFNDEFDILRGN